MRIVLRWLYRCSILLWREEWMKARIDREVAVRLHQVKTTTHNELAMFQQSLIGLERLNQEAVRALQRIPIGQELVLDLLEARLQEYQRAVWAAAKDQRSVA